MARMGRQLREGDEVVINGQTLTVLEVSDAASMTVHLSDDYMLRISGNKHELFKRTRLAPDKEDIRAVPLSSLKIMKKE